jgi:gas vesicle protein
MMRLIRFLAGLIVGMALGGAIAMLLAPKSGSETRELLRSRVEFILEEGRQAAESSRTDSQARLTELKSG